MGSLLLRAAAPADYEAYCRLFPELGRPDTPVSREVWERDVQEHILVADADGQVVAYCFWGEAANIGRVNELVVDAAWRGHQIAPWLLDTVARRLRARGLTEWALNVKDDNVSALRLYERLGFRITSRWCELRLPLSGLARLPSASWLTIEHVTQAHPTPVTSIARDVTGLMVGTLHFWPEKSRAELVGVKRPEIAASLLQRCSAEMLTVVVHDSMRVVTALQEAGAKLVLAVREMRGRIP